MATARPRAQIGPKGGKGEDEIAQDGDPGGSERSDLRSSDGGAKGQSHGTEYPAEEHEHDRHRGNPGQGHLGEFSDEDTDLRLDR